MLSIRDPRAAKLAKKLAAQRKTTMTDAIIVALENELRREQAKLSFDQRNGDVLAMADALGVTDPEFDMKRFTDEMWGDN